MRAEDHAEEAPSCPDERFPCLWVTTRRAGFSRLLSRLSAFFMLASPVLGLALEAAAPVLRWPELATQEVWWVILFCVGTLGTTLFAVASAIMDRERAGGAAELAVEEHDLVLHRGSRVRVIARDRIAGGFVLPTHAESILELRLTDGRVLRAGMRERGPAEALLDLLGVGGDRRRAVVTLGRQRRALAAGCLTYPLALVVGLSLLTLINAGHRVGPWLLVSLVVASTLLARRAFRPREVVVGADGVRVRGPFRERFLRLDEIADVQGETHELTLELRPEADPRGRGPLVVPCPEPGMARGLAGRVREALDRVGGRPRGAAVEHLLDPGAQRLGAWRAALARVLREEGRYRSAPVTAADVLAVLEDPAAPPRLRIGAAVAAREGGEPGARERVRIAAERCADEALREALAAAAEEEMDEATIARALRVRR